MPKKKSHAPHHKFNIVLESIKQDKVSEVARNEGLSPNQVSNWRKQFLDNGYKVFETTTDTEIVKLRKQIEKLEQIIGKKEVELNLLKNYTNFYTSQSGT